MSSEKKPFLCKKGEHRHWTQEKADRCPICRGKLDTAVRNHFRRISDKMLKDAGVDPTQDQVI